MKWPLVEADVASTAPSRISAGNTPVPAKANPEMISNQYAALFDRFGEIDAARAAPAMASSKPGVTNPIKFHSTALGEPITPSSLTAFTTWEYDGLKAANTYMADQLKTPATIPESAA
jgi:hypothetical protein